MCITTTKKKKAFSFLIVLGNLSKKKKECSKLEVNKEKRNYFLLPAKFYYIRKAFVRKGITLSF